MAYLDVIANVASIVTAIVAGGFAVITWCAMCAKRKRLEEYLMAQEASNPKEKAHTVVHLMAKLGMTEAEILRASFASRHVTHKIRPDYDTGLAAQLLFEYCDVPKRR